MTSSTAGGGAKPYTLPIDGSGVLLTEYATPGQALLVINTSNTDVAYVANHSGVGATSGVPLEPGTALPWTEGGQVWASAPGASAPIVVYITTAAAGWSPSPASVAAAVAAQGVPLSYLDHDFGQFTLLHGTNIDIDVHLYASVFVVCTSSPTSVIITFKNQGKTAQQYQDSWSNPAGADPAEGSSLYTVAGYWLNIQNGDLAGSRTFRVIGSNRPIPERVFGAFNDGSPMLFAAASQAMLAGTDYAVPTNDFGGIELQGLVSAEFSVTGSTVPKGYFFLTYEDSVSVAQQQRLADTTEMHIIGNDQSVTKLCALPRVGYSIKFHCLTAGTGALRAVFTKAGGP